MRRPPRGRKPAQTTRRRLRRRRVRAGRRWPSPRSVCSVRCRSSARLCGSKTRSWCGNVTRRRRGGGGRSRRSAHWRDERATGATRSPPRDGTTRRADDRATNQQQAAAECGSRARDRDRDPRRGAADNDLVRAGRGRGRHLHRRDDRGRKQPATDGAGRRPTTTTATRGCRRVASGMASATLAIIAKRSPAAAAGPATASAVPAPATAAAAAAAAR